MMAKELLKRIEKLPLDLQKEVLDYLEFLEKKYLIPTNKEKDFEFRWEGCLKHMREKYSSVELQHKALEWW